MKRSRLSRLGMLVAGGWLATGMAWAAAPDEGSRVGGIPRCETELAECTINLTETEGLLQVCEEALAACQATQGQAFPATGQVSCWDSAGNLLESCAGTGHDGEIQAGADLSYTDNGLTITDNNTQLEWMKQDDNNGDCASLPGSLDKDCTFTWDEAFNFVASLNAANHAGGDWRVPNAKELQSIVNYENFNPAVSADEFNTGCEPLCTVDACSCTAKSVFWSSTSFAIDPDEARAFEVALERAGVAADNGGPTPTVALLNSASNPALDTADPADAPATDQRARWRCPSSTSSAPAEASTPSSRRSRPARSSSCWVLE